MVSQICNNCSNLEHFAHMTVHHAQNKSHNCVIVKITVDKLDYLHFGSAK